jgi:hypothetical protein
MDPLHPALSPVGLTVDHVTETANSFYERLHKQIQAAEAKLGPGQSIGLLHNGPTGPFHVERIGFDGPDMIVFYGKDNVNRQGRLLVNRNAVSLMLFVVPAGSGSPRQIGFSGAVGPEV